MRSALMSSRVGPPDLRCDPLYPFTRRAPGHRAVPCSGQGPLDRACSVKKHTKRLIELEAQPA